MNYDFLIELDLITTRPLTTQGFHQLRTHLHTETWEEVLNAQSTDKKDKIWNLLMYFYINSSFPEKKKTICNNDKPWVNAEIRHLLRQKQKIYKLRDHDQLKSITKTLKQKIKAAKLQFRQKISSSITSIGSSDWYKWIKKVLNKNPPSLFTTITSIDELSNYNEDKVSILNRINNHFAAITTSDTPFIRNKLPAFLPSVNPPIIVTQFDVYKELCKINPRKSNSPQAVPSKILKECAIELCYIISHILNSSYATGEVPISWKTGYITALPKSATVLEFSDLRPITVTSNIAKLAEKFIHQQLMETVSTQICNQQFGVLPKSSTTHYLVQLFDFILKSLDKKSSPVLLTLLDCQKAFDRVDFYYLINRLLDLGVSGTIVDWVVGFLSDRKNCVRADGIYSNFRPMSRGLAQGSLNGPLTFIIVFDKFLRRIQEISNTSLQVYGFVDDATAAAIEDSSSSSDNPMTETVLQVARHAADEVKMSLNSKKTLVIKIDFTRNKPSNNWQFNVDGEQVNSSNKVTKLLGVVINNTLTWEDHIDYITTNAAKRFWALRSLQKLGCPPQELIIFYKSSILPLLEYASPVWSPAINVEQIRSLENVQCRAIRIITKKKLKIGTHEYTNTLSFFNLQLLVDRRENLLLKFGLSLLRSEKFRYLLPIFNPNSQDKRLRKQNLFFPIKCNRKRYQNSSIPTIVSLLNIEYRENRLQNPSTFTQ